MRVALIGGGGAIGRATTAALTVHGADVVTLTRSGATRIDRRDAQSVSALLRAERFDCVIDCIAYTAADTAPLLAALDGLVARYVQLSSCDVYRNYALLHRLESGAPDVGLLGEDAPLRTRRYPYRQDTPRAADDPERWMDDYEKIEVESAAQQLSRTAWTILRLPMVFGPGDKQRRFGWMMGPMRAGAAAIAAPAEWLDWVTTYGHVENVGAAIAHAALHPEAARAIFNVTDFAPKSHRWWIARIGAVMGWRGGINVLSDPAHPFVKRLAGLDLSVPFMASSAALQRLGYAPPITIDEALARTAADEASRG